MDTTTAEHWKEILEPVCMPAFLQFDDFYDYDLLRLLHEHFAPPSFTTFNFKVKVKFDERGVPSLADD